MAATALLLPLALKKSWTRNKPPTSSSKQGKPCPIPMAASTEGLVVRFWQRRRHQEASPPFPFFGSETRPRMPLAANQSHPPQRRSGSTGRRFPGESHRSEIVGMGRCRGQGSTGRQAHGGVGAAIAAGHLLHTGSFPHPAFIPSPHGPASSVFQRQSRWSGAHSGHPLENGTCRVCARPDAGCPQTWFCGPGSR